MVDERIWDERAGCYCTPEQYKRNQEYYAKLRPQPSWQEEYGCNDPEKTYDDYES